MGDESQQNQHTLFQTLILNAWAERDDQDELRWRFRLRHVRTDELTTFATPDALLDYLAELFTHQSANEE